MKIRKGSLKEFTNKVYAKEPFALSRYGDGEWASILGVTGENCDGVRYTPELQSELQRTIFEPKEYTYGILAIAARFFKPDIARFHTLHGIDIDWVESTFLVQANRMGRLAPFLEALATRTIIYVGPKHLERVRDFLPIKWFVEVPEKGAFEVRKEIQEAILESRRFGDFVAISAGPASKVIIYDIWDDLKDTHAVMDMGSVFDGYVGLQSRKYMRRDGWKNTMQKNLTGVLDVA